MYNKNYKLDVFDYPQRTSTLGKTMPYPMIKMKNTQINNSILTKVKTFKNKYLIFSLSLFSLLFFSSSEALVLALQTGTDVVGNVQHISFKEGETLSSIARQYDIGYYELLEANPHLNPYYLKNGMQINIPTQYVLPSEKHEGIIINLAELRLYYFPKDSNTVITTPLAIGRQGWDTPEGTFYIMEKIKNPTWHVPKSIAADLAKYGETLPASIPPGPDNPLGAYALRLNVPSYLLHGTNVPTTIGRRISAGCIRLYPEDIALLFGKTQVGTPVRIINEPYKIGFNGKAIVMEAHAPLSEIREKNLDLSNLWKNQINQFVSTQDLPMKIDWKMVDYIAHLQAGIPAQIGEITEAETTVTETRINNT